MNRRTDTALNWLVGTAVGWAVARLLGAENPARAALVVGAIVAVINWIGYEKPEVLRSIDGE
jgi:hypothetical protein